MKKIQYRYNTAFDINNRTYVMCCLFIPKADNPIYLSYFVLIRQDYM